VNFSNFALTFLVFPSQVLCKKNETILSSYEWSFLLLSFLFGLGDFAGRVVGTFWPPYSRKFLVSGLMFRIPLAVVILMNIFMDNTPWNSPFLISTMTFIYAITGGFISASCCTSVPCRLENHEQEFGGFTVSLTITAGITFGSVISLMSFN